MSSEPTTAFIYSPRYLDFDYGPGHPLRNLRLELTYDKCEMEQQVLARARKLGMSIVEIPHHSNGRIAGASKVIGVKQGLVDWLVILKERFAR